MPSEKYYKVNEFAKLCGVTPRTLKYYETRGLLRPALVGENGYRYYSLSQIDEISAILLFRDYGFSLEEIKTIMEQDDLAGIEQRMGMMLSIIKEQKRKLEQQAKTSTTPAPRSLRRGDISANHFCRTANPSALPLSRSLS